MRALILSRGPSLYSTQRLVTAFRRKGLAPLIIDPLECSLVFDG